jgi:hypothetical protein
MMMKKSIIFWDMTPCTATQQTTRHHIPEDDTLHNHRCENLKSYNDDEIQLEMYLYTDLYV